MNLNTTTDSFSSLGKFITELKDLKQIDTFNFENFLRVYKNTDNQYFFNLLTNSINIDENLDSSTYYEVRVEKSIPWTTISYNEYRTMHLWWLIMEVNKIRNPLEYPAPGTKLRILFPQYAKFVITKIIEKINSK